MNNPQQLKERIYALNPELKELTRGCEVEGVSLKLVTSDRTDDDVDYDELHWDKDEEFEYFIDGTEVISKDDKVPCVHQMNLQGSFIVTKILGHPIHLEHVLRAINETNPDCVWHTTRTGKAMKLHICLNGKESEYSLDKTFDQNIAENEELVTFLLNIIK